MGQTAGKKISTLALKAGESKSVTLNNANSEIFVLNAWPNAPAGTDASAEITRTWWIQHGSPLERELRFTVKNTGKSNVDVDVWALWWNK